MKEILDKAKKSIEANKSEYPTCALATTFHKPVGEESMYVCFVYGPQNISNHTQGQVLDTMNVDPINPNKQAKNQ